jgi:hypothetical protein
MYIPAVIQTEAGVFVADLTLQADDRRQQQRHAKLTSLTPSLAIQRVHGPVRRSQPSPTAGAERPGSRHGENGEDCLWPVRDGRKRVQGQRGQALHRGDLLAGHVPRSQRRADQDGPDRRRPP